MNESIQVLRVKTIDYRNARYQGFLHSKTSKRDGLGIVLDDDMNIYFAEWKNGLVHGMTLFLTAGGRVCYGEWRDGMPCGLNVFSNKEFRIYSTFI